MLRRIALLGSLLGTLAASSSSVGRTIQQKETALELWSRRTRKQPLGELCVDNENCVSNCCLYLDRIAGKCVERAPLGQVCGFMGESSVGGSLPASLYYRLCARCESSCCCGDGCCPASFCVTALELTPDICTSCVSGCCCYASPHKDDDAETEARHQLAEELLEEEEEEAAAAAEISRLEEAYEEDLEPEYEEALPPQPPPRRGPARSRGRGRTSKAYLLAVEKGGLWPPRGRHRGAYLLTVQKGDDWEEGKRGLNGTAQPSSIVKRHRYAYLGLPQRPFARLPPKAKTKKAKTTKKAKAKGKKRLAGMGESIGVGSRDQCCAITYCAASAGLATIQEYRRLWSKFHGKPCLRCQSGCCCGSLEEGEDPKCCISSFCKGSALGSPCGRCVSGCCCGRQCCAGSFCDRSATSLTRLLSLYSGLTPEILRQPSSSLPLRRLMPQGGLDAGIGGLRTALVPSPFDLPAFGGGGPFDGGIGGGSAGPFGPFGEPIGGGPMDPTANYFAYFGNQIGIATSGEPCTRCTTGCCCSFGCCSNAYCSLDGGRAANAWMGGQGMGGMGGGMGMDGGMMNFWGRHRRTERAQPTSGPPSRGHETPSEPLPSGVKKPSSEATGQLGFPETTSPKTTAGMSGDK